MQILAIDVGTGTQDILLFDTRQEPENALKMIMPSPTQIVAGRVRAATARGNIVLLTGATMGGGPCAWAADEHLKAGYQIYATPAAACTFDDDLQTVIEMGVQIISEDEAKTLGNVDRIVLRDFDLAAIRRAFNAFGVELEPDTVGIAVFDHGAAPAGYSDRKYRFDYLTRRLQQQPSLEALAFMSDQVPDRMTRMAAVVGDANINCPLLLMDTPSAAVLGAQEDPTVRQAKNCIAVNVGNAHTLAFRLDGERVTGLFEHHTGKLTTQRLDDYIEGLSAGLIDNDVVYADKGHGALVLDDMPAPLTFVSVTGPRRALLRDSRHPCYFAVPHGDMMVAGCWGLIRALAAHEPALAAEITTALPKR